ncbi:MAG TPA: ATP-grasp domain-containing protein [Terriglobales bacterium]|nr:ATP-grasp domain-containing protein [Terriglobales bacterium]
MAERWIGVTGFYTTDNPHPGLAVVRALRAADPSWRILALAWDQWGTGAFASDLLDGVALVPYPASGPAPLLERFRALVKRRPLDVVIPTIDRELPVYLALRQELARLGIRTCLPSAAALRAREKRHLPALGRRAHVLVPETAVLRTEVAADRAAVRRPLPQVLKGAMVDSLTAHTVEDFRVGARALASEWGWPILAQPVIPGEEYDVAVLAHGGEVLGSAVMKKLGITNKGTAWAGVTVDEPELVEQAGRLAKTLRWDGIFEAEFMRTAAGDAWCFEVNPRAPSWIALAADAGANLPAALVRLALGERVEPLSARPGRLFARALVEAVFPRNGIAALTHEQPGVRLGHDPQLPERVAAPALARRARKPGTVAITGLNAADNPSPGLTVARSLRTVSPAPRLIGFTHEILATGGYVDGMWDEVRVVPFPSREDGGYAEALLAHCRAAGVDCLIPTLDIEIPVIDWLAPRLKAAGVATLLPPPAALRAVAKPQLPQLAARGFPLPRTMAIPWPDALDRVSRTLGTPLVVKGPYADAKVVRNEEEARVAAMRLAATWGYPLIAQEFVEGQEYGVAAVADREHRVVGVVAVKKEIRTLNGNTWGGTTVVDEELTALARRFARALTWVGPFELEVIRHPRRGLFLIEVNPRFPAWVYLSAGAGANLPWAAVRLARGEEVAPLTTRAGAFYARMAWDATAPVERMGALAVEGVVDGHVA